jgi:Tfp pilus assembly protein PilN
MRAVNLVPAELRRGGGTGLAGRTGGAIYLIVGALVGLVAMAAAYGVTTHRIAQRRADIVTATRAAQVAEARAAALQPYVAFQTRRAARVNLVTSLANKRFDWSTAMTQIAEALPSDVVLSSLNGSGAGSAGGGGGGLRGAIPVPAVSLGGCAPTHPRVAAALDSLRRIPGVTVVSLSTSAKGSSAGNAPGGAPGGTPCGAAPATFQVTVFYTDPTAKGAPQQAAAASVPVAAGGGSTTQGGSR